MNLSDNSRRIKKGKHLANFEPVEYALDEELKSKRMITEENEVPLHLIDLYERSKSSLNDEQCQQLKKLLVEYQDVFSRDKNDLGRTGLTKHKIDVVGSEPIRQPARIPYFHAYFHILTCHLNVNLVSLKLYKLSTQQNICLYLISQ